MCEAGSAFIFFCGWDTEHVYLEDLIRFQCDLGFDLLRNTWTEEPEKDRRRVFQTSLSLAIYSWPGQTAGHSTVGTQNTVHGSS